MLSEPSSTSTRCVRWPAITAPNDSRNGLAIAETTRRTTSVRIARSSHCSIRIRRRFLRMAASRNRIAAQGTSRNLRRFKRWITIGHRRRRQPVKQRGVGESQGPDRAE